MATKKALTLKKATSVPNKNECTNFGGMDVAGDKVYCCKTSGDETLTTVYTYSKYNATTFSTRLLKNLGHANGMAYHDGYLYIPGWGKEVDNKGIWKISPKTGGTKKLLTGLSTGAIAHCKDNIFIIRTKTVEDKITFATVKMTEENYKVVNKVTIVNPEVAKHNMNQDIFYKAGKLYIPLTYRTTLASNMILVADIGKVDAEGGFPQAGKTISPTEIWSYKKDSKFEIESLAIDKYNRVLFGANTTSDGIYVQA